MFTLQTDHAAPSFLLFLPNKKIYAFVSPIETSLLEALKDKIEIISYRSVQNIFHQFKKITPKNETLLIEYSRYHSLDIITYSWMRKFQKEFRVKSAEDVLFPLRMTKTDEEVKLIQQAVKKTLKIMKKVQENILTGAAEIEINNLIYSEILGENLEPSFKPIIASGKRAVDPHPVRATNKKLEKGELVIVDMGVCYYGYASDITRTFLVGGDIKEHYFYKIAQEMIKKMESLKLSNRTPFQLSEMMKIISQKHNVKNYEKHGYGHGIGTLVHDIYPTISASRKLVRQEKFRDNVSFAFEPGFYTDKTGFRWENDYYIKKGRAVRFG